MTRQHHEDTLRNLGHSDPSLRDPSGPHRVTPTINLPPRSADSEIDAMEALYKLLAPFDDAARKRMIRYAIDRLKNVATEEEPS